jgi:hypothetical protein
MGVMVSVTPRPRFTPGERTPSAHWTVGWVDLRAGLDKEARVYMLASCGGTISMYSIFSVTTTRKEKLSFQRDMFRFIEIIIKCMSTTSDCKQKMSIYNTGFTVRV